MQEALIYRHESCSVISLTLCHGLYLQLYFAITVMLLSLGLEAARESYMFRVIIVVCLNVKIVSNSELSFNMVSLTVIKYVFRMKVL